jgi:tRNA nucleotidyltransferase (CCA-adding enzyme)
MPDYIFLLESRLSPEQRAALTRVQEIAQALEINVYLAGGAVRDLITGMPIRDLDFCVEGNPARIIRELEKGGARVLRDDQRLRHVELIFLGDVDGSLAAAREELYDRPGARPDSRWSTIVEDLKRRDFSCNALALSLNAASRGLLLDPTNGLADLEQREVRILSMHGFTNQPARLLRLYRYAERLEFRIEPRTADWAALARERELDREIDPADAGFELRQLAREDRPVQILKAWGGAGLLEAFHPRLGRRKPDYDGLAKLVRMREAMISAGYRQLVGDPVSPRLLPVTLYYVFARLSSRERQLALGKMGFRAAEREAVAALEDEAKQTLKVLSGRKTAKPRDAYNFLDQTPLAMQLFLQARFNKPGPLSRIRNYLFKWKPLRAALPVSELEGLGIPRGPKFDRILEQFFDAQLAGRAKTPEDRIKLLRRLAGIKPEPKKKEKPPEEKKPAKKPSKKQAAADLKAAQAGKQAASQAPAAAPAASAPPAQMKPAAAPAKKKPSPKAAAKPKPRSKPKPKPKAKPRPKPKKAARKKSKRR